MYSQKTIFQNNDTLIGFTVNQSRFLLKTVYELEECDTLKSIVNKQFQNEKLKNSIQNKIIDNDKLIIANKDSIISIKVDELALMTSDRDRFKRKMVWQKIQKTVFFSTTLLISGLYIWQTIKL